MSELSITQDNENGVCVVHFSGSIDEDADFSPLSDLKTTRVLFDFNKIKTINSCGIREWVNFVHAFNETAEIIYVQCPQVIIEQINMVAGFVRPGAVIESFYAPYFCSSCDAEKRILIKTKQVKNSEAPAQCCDVCKSDLEFDALEKQYFFFMQR